MDGFQRNAGLGVEGDEVVEHLLDESIGGGQGNVDDVVAVVLRGIVLGRVRRVEEPVGRVPGRAVAVFHGLDRGAGMARDVEFGHDEHVARIGVLEDFDVVGLGVEAVAGGLGVVPVRGDAVGVHQGVWLGDRAVLVQGRNAAVGAVGREFRETVHLHTPAFVVAEVQVQAVHFVMGQDVNEFQEVGLAREVPAHVQHDAAVGEVGPVFHDGVRDGIVAGVAPEVVQGDGRVIQAVLVGRLDGDLAVDGDFVPAGLFAFHQVPGDVVRDRGRALGDIDLLQPGNHVVGRQVCRGIVKGMHRLRREEDVFHLHGNGFPALDLQVEAFRGTALVHQGAGLVAEDHFVPFRFRRGGDAVQGAAVVEDLGFRPILHLDGRAELGEPEGPVGAGGRVLDGHRVDGLPGLRVGGTFGPDDPAGLRAGDSRQADGEGKQRFGVHGQAVLFPKPKMAKKKKDANRLTHFVYSNTQIFV